MSIEVLVPNLPESVSDATLITWHKKAGDFVATGENLIDLETDKVVLEVPAPESGILGKILKENGATVISGDLLALLNPQTEPIDEPNQIAAEPSETPLSPAVRRLIQENELDPALITGSGKNGRLTKTDVLSYIEEQPEQHEAEETQAEVEPPVSSQEEPEATPIIKPGLGPELRWPIS